MVLSRRGDDDASGWILLVLFPVDALYGVVVALGATGVEDYF
jgi:hypothetical protein